MPWTIDHHRLSAQEALARGLISGSINDLADVPEPQQSSEHQARVAALSILNEIGGVNAVVEYMWMGETWPYPTAPPPPSDGWGDGKAFGSRPSSDVIHLRNEHDLVIEDLSFEGHIWQPGRPHNAHVSILLENCTGITIRDCDFQDVSEPVAVIGGSDIVVEWTRTNGIVGPGSRVDEQTGNFLQTVGQPSRVKIWDNKIVASTDTDPWGGQYETMTEDVISLFSASDCEVFRNRIDATGYTREYGTGIIAGDANGDGHMVADNWLLNPGQVGLATAGGFGHRFSGNRLWRDSNQVHGSGNTAAYFWGYQGNPIGDGRYESNRAKWHGGGGFWNPGGAVEVSNDWDDDGLVREDFEVTL